MKKTVVFDFDGVIHSYESGWKGETVIPDPPVPGIKEAIDNIRSAGYEVVVVSTRCSSEEAPMAIGKYLSRHDICVDDVRKETPPAIVYIDDRAICFDGKPENLLEKIQKFKPWNKWMKKITERILDLLTYKKRKIPLVYINFNYPKYMADGVKGSCVCSIHPDLAHDENLVSMLNEIVDYVRNNYDMRQLTEI